MKTALQRDLYDWGPSLGMGCPGVTGVPEVQLFPTPLLTLFFLLASLPGLLGFFLNPTQSSLHASLSAIFCRWIRKEDSVSLVISCCFHRPWNSGSTEPAQPTFRLRFETSRHLGSPHPRTWQSTWHAVGARHNDAIMARFGKGFPPKKSL